MNSRDLLYIKDIISALNKIETYIKNISEAEFARDELKQEAVLFNLQIIGEAVAHISIANKRKYDTVDWKKLRRLRNFIAHQYFKVDPKDVWLTIKLDLPKVRAEIMKIEKDVLSLLC